MTNKFLSLCNIWRYVVHVFCCSLMNTMQRTAESFRSGQCLDLQIYSISIIELLQSIGFEVI